MDKIIKFEGVVLETNRILLRCFEESDLDDLYEYASADDVGIHAGWKPHQSKDKSKEILKIFCNNKSDFAIVDKQTNKVIGAIGNHATFYNKSVPAFNEFIMTEIGYVVSKDYWKQGIATEASKLVIKQLFDSGVELLSISHSNYNVRSKRVIEKSGYTFYEYITYYNKLLGEERPSTSYIMSRSDRFFIVDKICEGELANKKSFACGIINCKNRILVKMNEDGINFVEIELGEKDLGSKKLKKCFKRFRMKFTPIGISTRRTVDKDKYYEDIIAYYTCNVRREFNVKDAMWIDIDEVKDILEKSSVEYQILCNVKGDF